MDIIENNYYKYKQPISSDAQLAFGMTVLEADA